ncbi:hypothetical protein DI09_21p290 [Mitosporidium daphniae]|uniref:NAD(P)H-hydrate epimerase n=1 Tax=Mitosporidium daphniae TaxID=1485682 RepID=A0A098VST3_9MICR|nr:uncharacterized protein DI09_21p290 [Mitosporidium daphniae]KGG52057.1 hypothetical protein DI09_21p290 [Mitosporidium daphniae]|eukprot:XP_013238484.1 uncharacterized protein DI09_21p290 [Mitosporidium daphniae]
MDISFGNACPVPTFISSSQAQEIDKRLLDIGYTIGQLVELAGLSISQAIYHYYPPSKDIHKKPIILIGPGNNGADGLVVARHLARYGYMPTLVIVKQFSPASLNSSLLKICEHLNICIVDSLSKAAHCGFIIDAVLGFGSTGSVIKEPYGTLIDQVVQINPSLLISIDVPTGWLVDHDNSNRAGLIRPHTLISLTLPVRAYLPYCRNCLPNRLRGFIFWLQIY